MKKLLLSTLLASCLFYSFANATEPENYSQDAKQIALERLYREDSTLKPDGVNQAKLYDKNGNLILEMNLNFKRDEKISFSQKKEQDPWEGVPWYVYDESGNRYEMTDEEKKDVFIKISGSMFGWMGKIQ